MKRFILVPILLFTICNASFSQPNEEYIETVGEMLTVSGTEATFETTIIQMLDLYKDQYQDIPADAWNVTKDEMLKTSLDDLVEMLSPVYYRHLTLLDLKGVIRFYKTPVAMKYAEKAPIITRESMQAGQEWGMKLAIEIEKKIKALGY